MTPTTATPKAATARNESTLRRSGYVLGGVARRATNAARPATYGAVMPEPSLATADAYLSMTTAARHYEVHRDTIKRAIERGELPAVRVGTRGLIRVRVADLERWARPVRNGAESVG